MVLQKAYLPKLPSQIHPTKERKCQLPAETWQIHSKRVLKPLNTTFLSTRACNQTSHTVNRTLPYVYIFEYGLGSGTSPIGFVIEFYPFCPIGCVRSSIFGFLIIIYVFYMILSENIRFLVSRYLKSQERRWLRSLRGVFVPQKNVKRKNDNNVTKTSIPYHSVLFLVIYIYI